MNERGGEPIERIPIAAIRKNTRDDLRLELTKMQDGKWRFAARVWYATSEGEMRPGRDGWTMKIAMLPDIAAAIDAAVKEARDRALIELRVGRNRRGPMAAGAVADDGDAVCGVKYAASKEEASRSTAWTRSRLDWIDAIALDRRIPAEAFRLAHVLQSRFVNSKTGEGWPSQETLGELLGVSDRQIRKLLTDLIEKGWLEARRGGKGKPNRYRMTGTVSSTQEVLMTGTDSTSQNGSLTGTETSLDRNSRDTLTGTESSDNLVETSEKNLGDGVQPSSEDALRSNEGQRSTVNVIEAPPLDAAASIKLCFIGRQIEHPTYGHCEVVAVAPVERLATLQVQATGKRCTTRVPDDVEFCADFDDTVH